MPSGEENHDHDLDNSTPPSTPPTPHAIPSDPLADVFSSHSPSNQHHDEEVSDIPRLRSVHATAGYRAGVTAGKQATLQRGFDEGYSLGASFGFRVGEMLGLLEGIEAALHGGEGGTKSGAGRARHKSKTTAESTRPQPGVQAEGQKEQGKRISGLLDQARTDMKLESLFGREYWGEDGLWRYPVTACKHDEAEAEEEGGSSGSTQKKQREEEGKGRHPVSISKQADKKSEIAPVCVSRQTTREAQEEADGHRTSHSNPEERKEDPFLKEQFGAEHDAAGGATDLTFTDIVSSHPLIRKWNLLLKQELRTWGLDGSTRALRQASTSDATGQD